MEQIYTPKQDYKVLVRCMTFNQSKYIEDTLNGFAMQKTDFPFVCHVQDDCSTDGEQEVIKAWMDRECDMEKAEYVELDLSKVFIVPHKTNPSCTFCFYFLKKNMYREWGKKIDLVKPWRNHCVYEALCEGDDYWITPSKLQEQADILDSNEENMLVGTNGIVLWENYTDRAIVFNSYNIERDLTMDEILGKWVFPTAGLMYKVSLMEKWPEWTRKIYSGDLTLVLIAASRGKIVALPRIACVYRCNKNGDSVSMNVNRLTVVKNHLFLYKEYNAYTDRRYEEIIRPIINDLAKEQLFLELYDKIGMLAMFKYPMHSLNLIKDRMKKIFLRRIGKRTTLV